MPPDASYQIPEQSAERTRANLYGYYRQRLDEEAQERARRRSGVIDVAATRVSLEDTAAERANRQTLGVVSDQGAKVRTADSRPGDNRPRRTAPQNTDAENAAFMYEPRSASGEIDLKRSPAQRGVFIDLMA